jgi:RHS repeat-associated protein
MTPPLRHTSLSTGVPPGWGYRCAGRYRYGFNGKESDDEVSVADGSYDFGARMYDARLGRWWSVDGFFGEYPYHSPYLFVAASPIYFIDPDGNKLRVAGNKEKAINDLRSLVPEEYRPYLKYEDSGEVYWDYASMYAAKLIHDGTDPGIVLINQLIDDMDEKGKDKLHEYNVAKTVILGIAKESDGSRISSTVEANLESGLGVYLGGKDDSKIRGSLQRTNNLFASVSSEPMQENLQGEPYTMFEGVPYFETPLDQNLTSQLTIPENTSKLLRIGSVEEIKPRTALIFHELTELYLRGKGYSYKQAHEEAIKIEIAVPDSNKQGLRDKGSEGKANPIRN